MFTQNEIEMLLISPARTIERLTRDQLIDLCQSFAERQPDEYMETVEQYEASDAA